MRVAIRNEDMSQHGYLKILVQSDGDVIVAVYPQEDGMVGVGGSVEFCIPGTGGGRSTHTHAALRALADAMERDNKERPIAKAEGVSQGLAATSQQGQAPEESGLQVAHYPSETTARSVVMGKLLSASRQSLAVIDPLLQIDRQPSREQLQQAREAIEDALLAALGEH